MKSNIKYILEALEKSVEKSENKVDFATIKNEIKKIIKDNSYFELLQEDDDGLRFGSRLNGNIANETYGIKDVQEAKKIKTLILDKFPFLKVSIEDIDEWIDIYIKLREKEAEKTYWIHMKKNDKGAGSSWSKDNIEDAVKDIKIWTKYKPEVIRQKLLNLKLNEPWIIKTSDGYTHSIIRSNKPLGHYSIP